MPEAVLTQAAAMGILSRYKDNDGALRETSVKTAEALMLAMGAEAGDTALPSDVICEAGTVPDLSIKGDWHLTLEDGQQLEGRGPLPALPLGIHHLSADDQTYTLLSAPPRLPWPARCWGLIAPLYGLPERGIGSFDDLAKLAQDLGPTGADFLGINPVHAGFPTEPGLFSPYTPSHRRRLNALLLPGGKGTPGALLNYARDVPERMAALRAEFDGFTGDPRFDAFCTEEGDSLHRFALHQCLSTRHGPFWSDWPTALQDASSTETRSQGAGFAEDIRFHSWLQWRAETALEAAQQTAKAAAMAHGLYLDLAVGTHPHGAETWEDPGSFARGAALGAPPDAFSPDGQNWGLAPFNPRALRRTGYAALAQTLRRQLRHAGVLRIDHILGFERAFWVPQGAPGGYVQMPRYAMLAVARIEAARADAVIVGEDLGNLPDGLRESLEGSGILGCRVTMFERSSWQPLVFTAATDYDAAAIASFSTHDLPTWQGWRAGADIEARATLTGADASAETKDRTIEVDAMDALLDTPDEDGLHGFLAQTPARLVAVQAEIALEMRDQPNLPGTVDEYPNWRRRMPVPTGAISCHDGIQSAARIMAAAGRGQRSKT